MNKFASVDEYIDSFPPEIKKILTQIRQTIKESAPGAQESIAYGMPAYKLNNSPLVYFAAFKNHIGFYPTPYGIASFESELAKYKHAKGSIQFPLSEPMPIELIIKIVKFRVQESDS